MEGDGVYMALFSLQLEARWYWNDELLASADLKRLLCEMTSWLPPLKVQ
jgi:hypothetical protein